MDKMSDIWTTKIKQLYWQSFSPLFLLDKSNRERKKKRDNKNIIRVWERKSSQKLFKNSCLR